jgi:Helix-turn-helix domain
MGRKQEAAIAALLTHWSVEEAARVAGIGAQTLYRWLDDPDFAAAYRKATLVTYRQSIGRLQQSSGALVSVLVTVMRDPAATASTRARAADRVLRHAKTATETEQVAVRFAELKRAQEASKQERRANDGAAPAGERGSSRIKGHGAKFPRRHQAAIIALLTHRNIPEAARAIGISTQTLYRWMGEEEFAAAYLQARLAAFGRASARLRLVAGEAITTLQNIAGDPRTTPGMRGRAADIALSHAGDASAEDIEACVAELDGSRALLTVLHADRRMFEDIARERPRLAA